MNHVTAVISLLLLCAPVLRAVSLTGQVVNTEGQPLEAVTVVTDMAGVGALSDDKGRFVLDTDEPVTRVTFSSVGYRSVQYRVADLPQVVVLEPVYIRGEDIVVAADRARTGVTPTAFANFSRQEIERDHMVGELPLLLESTPNLYAFSYAGGGLGATEYKIRGFDSKRVSVYIDGVPLNDPEDHATYFVDIPDFAAGVQDVQVQRGVGMSAFGDASFGGSVNIASAGLTRARRITVTSGFGGLFEGTDYIGDMRKQSVEYSSGLIDGRWSLSGRYSKQYSDGYREHSWFDGWAYFFSLSRLDPKMTTTVNLYGGPIRYHMAWYGISRDELETNRRYNPTPYDNQTDNFNQPHYELHHRFQIDENLLLRNTLYYIRGKGFYEQFKEGRDIGEYNIPDSYLADPAVEEIDLVRQKWVTKSQYGWHPRLDWVHARGSASIGANLYYFSSEHWGQVIWAEQLTSALDPRHKYYEYFGKKYLASSYVQGSYRATDRVRLQGTLQLKYLKYRFKQTMMGLFVGYQYSMDWLFLSPRLGVTYQLTDGADLFASFAVSSREPDDKTIYDADDPDAFPALKRWKLAIDAERVYDFELGGNLRHDRGTVGLNLYWIEFRNEIVAAGGLDEDGLPIMGNADRSVHAGLELSGRCRINRYLTASGNASCAFNRLREYYVYKDMDWDGVADDTLDYSGNPVAGFPEYLASLILDSRVDPMRFVLRLRAAGRQYIENGNNRELSIDPHLVTSLSTSVALGELAEYGLFTLAARVDNLFNTKYEAFGAADDWGAYYIPAAERTFFVQLKWELE